MRKKGRNRSNFKINEENDQFINGQKRSEFSEKSFC
jgi:hypothetical protein